MRKLYVLLIALSFAFTVKAQVDVSTGGGPTTYSNLKLAFDAINLGTHTGAITIDITGAGSYTDPAASAVLNSSGIGSASYTSVLIRPTADGAIIKATTVGGRGVIELNGADNVTIDGDNPNTAGTNRNLIVQNLAVATTTYTSCVRVATTNVTGYDANNITIKNLTLLGNVSGGNLSSITSTTGSSNASFGVVVGSGGGASVTATASVTPTMSTTAPAPTVNNFIVSNCSVNQVARGIMFAGGNAASSNSVTIDGNMVGATATLSGTAPYTSPASTVYTKGIIVQGLTSLAITNNTVQNILSYVGTTISGIELTTAIGTSGGTVNVNNNTINGVANNGTVSGAIGILFSSATIPYTVSSNQITNVQTLAVTSCSGMSMSSTGASGLIEKNKINYIQNRSVSTYGAYGISVSAGTAITIQNNFVSDINQVMTAGGAFSTTFGVFGIRIGGGTNHKVYNNSVNLSGLRPGTAASDLLSASFAITATTLTGIDVRNNIFANTITGGTTNISNVSVYLPSGGTSTMNLTFNNNAYYSGADPSQGVLQVGTTPGTGFYTAPNFNSALITPAANSRSYTSTLSAAGTNDNASFADINPAPFTSSTDLHIPNGTNTPLESGGANIGVITDIDGQARPNGTASDIGADEFVGILVDVTPPIISYTPLPNTCGSGSRTITATITDVSGVPTSGAGLPVLYYRINGGSYVASQSTYIGSNQYQFNLGSGSVTGDLVYYYIVAQDNVGTPNVGAFPATGASGFTANPPAASTTPTTPNSYALVTPMSGTYTVGVGGNYSTITAAVADYNGRCLSGSVVFNLTDASYPSETFPITILNNLDASAVKTLTIKPAAGIATLITGSNASALLKLNGADNVIIDGLNTGGSSLTFTNTNSSSTATVLWLASANASDGATNNTIKNVNVAGTGSTTLGGLLAGSGTTLGNTAEAPNSNNTIQGCSFTKLLNAIFVNGNTTFFDQNWLITGNSFGSSVVADKLAYRAISVQAAQNFIISKNVIAGVITSTTSTATGISIFTLSSNGFVFGNSISDIKNTNTGGYGANGIYLGSSTASNIRVYNNYIYDVAAYGFAGSTSADNGYGIIVETGSGYNIYYNTVVLNTNQTLAGGLPAAFNISSTIIAAGAIDVRDNLFSNNQTVGTNRYAIYSAAANTVFSNINYNNYYSGGPNLGYIGSNRADLAAIQAGFGGNTNSTAIQPTFMSATDFRLDLTANTALDNTGTPIAGIATDFDNVGRSSTTPDLGADEFTTGGTLPANLLTFSGARTGGVNNLKWSVAQEVDVQAYELERSEDGRSWINVGTVSSLGNTASQRSYSYTDNNISGLKQLYRLRQVDRNGSAKLSNIVVISGVRPTVLSLSGLFPNPAVSKISLLVDAPAKDNITIVLMDAVGRVVRSQQASVDAGANTLSMDVSGLSQGSYMVKLTCQSNCQSTVSKFVKE